MERKTPNKFKAFYQLHKARKSMDLNSMDYKHLEEPFVELLMDNKNHTNNEYDDSFDQALHPLDSQKDIIDSDPKI